MRVMQSYHLFLNIYAKIRQIEQYSFLRTLLRTFSALKEAEVVGGEWEGKGEIEQFCAALLTSSMRHPKLLNLFAN